MGAGLLPAQRDARERWEKIHGPYSHAEQWDAPGYRFAFPASAKGDDEWTARAEAGVVAAWEGRGADNGSVPLYPLEQLTAGKIRRKPEPVSCPGGASATPAPLTRCPRPVRAVRRLRDLVTGQHTRGEAVELPCWTKRCEFCAPELRRRLVGHYVHALKGLPYLRFVTLTVDRQGSGVTAVESRKYLLYCWEKFRKRVARRCEASGHRFVFVGTLEQHESGYFHLHVLCSAPLGDDELRGQAFAARFGAVCDVQLLSDAAPDGDEEANELARLVGYCMSYACKDAAASPNRRSIVNSQGIGYHSNDAKQSRAAYVAQARGLDPAAVLMEYWNRRAAAAAERTERSALLDVVLARARAIVGPLGRIVPLEQADLPVRRVVEEEWITAPNTTPRACADVLTREDRKRFGALSRSRVRFVYVERRRRDMVQIRHVYDRVTGAHTSSREEWDGRGRASNNQ